MSEGAEGRGPSHRAVEAGVAIAMAAFGLIVIAGAMQVGIGWGAEVGPRSGFIPFYVGLTIVGASVINLMHALASSPNTLFAEWGQLRQVVSIVIPTAIYVVAVPWLGIYASSILLIAIFMMWLGRYSASMSIGIAVGVMVITYLTFERWFLVPLPKGPIEDLLGL